MQRVKFGEAAVPVSLVVPVALVPGIQLFDQPASAEKSGAASVTAVLPR